MSDPCLTCVLSECNDRDPRCAFVKIKPRVVQAEHDAERSEKRKAHDKRMYENNKAIRLTQARCRYQSNGATIRAKVRQYQLANPDKRKVWNRRYKQKIRESAQKPTAGGAGTEIEFNVF